MSLSIILSHLALGILLFFISNWIGKHSYSIGYIEISIFTKEEEAPAFNFIFRVLTPIVYLVIVSTILYYFRLDIYVVNIYWISIFYILFRLFFNLVTDRVLLINWRRQFGYWLVILALSFFVYEKIIKVKTNLLPDFTTISNELWIIILIFLFQIANNVRLSQDGAFERKQAYIRTKYRHFKAKYGTVIEHHVQNEILQAIVYSIMIYEDFNRPKAIRILENITHKFSSNPHTLGVMQVRSEKLINDYQSVELGIQKIKTAYSDYLKMLNEEGDNHYYDFGAYTFIASKYNGGARYGMAVAELISIIVELFYRNSQDSLDPNGK